MTEVVPGTIHCLPTVPYVSSTFRQVSSSMSVISACRTDPKVSTVTAENLERPSMSVTATFCREAVGLQTLPVVISTTVYAPS